MPQELDVVYQIFAFQRIIIEFIEHNPNLNIIKLSPLYNLEFIYLRGKENDNNSIVQLIGDLQFGVNKISQEGVNAMAKYMNITNALEYLGLVLNQHQVILRYQHIHLANIKYRQQNFLKFKNQSSKVNSKYKNFRNKKKVYLILVLSYIKIDNFNYNLQNLNLDYETCQIINQLNKIEIIQINCQVDFLAFNHQFQQMINSKIQQQIN
ncbi:unnamed protein product [Paramecium sonneborni]|uniref:Uncharacterized protein n=1 Tax=Paramecium sonneborni TaxID=65129 RepID=A0A8S1QIV5_9CILI|nr:unnamed protein product [Paramecium sonneborni]